MSVSNHRRTADVIAFRRRADERNRFTLADRIEFLEWEARDRTGARLAIHKRRDGDPPDVEEFASIYPPEGVWAAWGAVRQGLGISVWRSRDGRDIGVFATMGEALAAVAASRGKPRLQGCPRADQTDGGKTCD